jgi:hypothetical protein
VSTLVLPAQSLWQQDFGWAKSEHVVVLDIHSRPLAYPWAGGMNSVKFSTIDLNLDGDDDLFAFDKHGDRILTYIYKGQDSIYEYAPHYARSFPTLHDWVQLVDYDNDNKKDIFTYGLAGIAVYHNISDTSLKFELMTSELQSFYYHGNTNIYASSADYPAIADLDGDGDLDILNFWVLGTFVHAQKNYAREQTGKAGLVDFKLWDECWGKFSEGSDNHVLSLQDYCGHDDALTRHAGSTLSVVDWNGDGLPDLVIGDSDYPRLTLLYNGGNASKALMIEQDSLFPNPTCPVNLFSMPALSEVDINHDGVMELLVSPADPSLFKSADHKSVWLYVKDTNTEKYTLRTTEFLQEDMIDMGSGSVPVLYDWDGDGLLDLFIGNYGRYDSSRFEYGVLYSFYSSSIAYYKNTGTYNNPVFQYITDDFGDIRQWGARALYPVFGDFNGDGLCDVLCGNADGDLLFFANQGNDLTGLPTLATPVHNFQDVTVGYYSAPQYFDLDRDGNRDLLVGNRRGHVAYFRDASTNNIPLFIKITDTLGGIDTRDYENSYFGYATPFFFRNHRDETVLLCGSEQGHIFYYKDIDQRLDKRFTLVHEPVYALDGIRRVPIQEGKHVAVSAGYLHADGYLDLLAGNWAGGIGFYKGIVHPDSTTAITPFQNHVSISGYPNPCTDFFTLNLPKNIPAQIFDISLHNLAGKKIYHAKIHKNNPVLDLSRLPASMYIGILQNDNQQQFFFKVVKR